MILTERHHWADCRRFLRSSTDRSWPVMWHVSCVVPGTHNVSVDRSVTAARVKQSTVSHQRRTIQTTDNISVCD